MGTEYLFQFYINSILHNVHIQWLNFLCARYMDAICVLLLGLFFLCRLSNRLNAGSLSIVVVILYLNPEILVRLIESDQNA